MLPCKYFSASLSYLVQYILNTSQQSSRCSLTRVLINFLGFNHLLHCSMNKITQNGQKQGSTLSILAHHLFSNFFMRRFRGNVFCVPHPLMATPFWMCPPPSCSRIFSELCLELARKEGSRRHFCVAELYQNMPSMMLVGAGETTISKMGSQASKMLENREV